MLESIAHQLNDGSECVMKPGDSVTDVYVTYRDGEPVVTFDTHSWRRVQIRGQEAKEWLDTWGADSLRPAA